MEFAVCFLTSAVAQISKATLIALGEPRHVAFRDSTMTRRRSWPLSWAAPRCCCFLGLVRVLLHRIYQRRQPGGDSHRAVPVSGCTACEQSVEEPWIGNGIDSVWKVVPPFGPELFEARHAENEILQQFYAYGLVGIVMLVGIYGRLWRPIRRMPRSPTRAFSVACCCSFLFEAWQKQSPSISSPALELLRCSARFSCAARSLKGPLAIEHEWRRIQEA